MPDPDHPLTPESRRVPAAHGWYWVRDGWRLCARKPLTWLVFTLMTCLLLRVASLHPMLVVATALLMPVLLAGWAGACRQAEAGRSIPVTALFDGFRNGDRVRRLAAIGGINLLGNLALMTLALTLGGEGLAEALSNPEAITPEQAGALQSRLMTVLLVVAALSVPLAMAVWFAPVGVMLDGLGGPAALMASLRGIARNPLAFAVYGALLAAAGLLIVSLAGLGGLGLPGALELAFWALLPLLVASVWSSYQDIFHGGPAFPPKSASPV